MGKRRGHGEGGIYQRESDGRWCAAVDLGYVKGKRKRKMLYGRTRKEVADKLKALHRDQAAGVPIVSEHLTVQQFLEIWLTQVVNVRNRPRTYENYAQIVHTHIVPTIGPRQLTRLTPEHVQALINQLIAQGLAPRTIRNVRAVLRKALNQAVRWGKLGRNVAALVEIPRAAKVVIMPLTPEQARALLEAVCGDILEALYRIALSLGLRRGEILAVRWEDIDFERQMLAVTGAIQRHSGRLQRVPTKSDAGVRTLFLPIVLIQVLRAHQARQDERRELLGDDWQEHGLVFPSNVGTPMEPGNLDRRFKQVLRQVGLPETIRFHDLRHSCATLLLAQGVPLIVVRDMLGHTQISTTADIYGHVLPESQRQAAETMEALLAGRKGATTAETIPYTIYDAGGHLVGEATAANKQALLERIRQLPSGWIVRAQCHELDEVRTIAYPCGEIG